MHCHYNEDSKEMTKQYKQSLEVCSATMISQTMGKDRRPKYYNCGKYSSIFKQIVGRLESIDKNMTAPTG